MRERVLEVADEIFFYWGKSPQDRGDLKAALTFGEHNLYGTHYFVHKDWVPDDAVLSIPEKKVAAPRVWVYHVLSDEFTADQPDVIMTEITRINSDWKW